MNKNLYLLIFSLLILVQPQLYAQNANVSTNTLTGALTVGIPIYTITNGSVSLPVNLTYFTNGVRPKEVEGTAGIGWNLSAGGQIVRGLRGLPDDVSADDHANARYGWMNASNSGPAAIMTFNIQNDGGTTCSKEISDISYINSNFSAAYDTEPDIFTINAPGLNCQIVYNRTLSKFVAVSADDIKISYTNDASTGLINSFTIVNNQGTKYVFAVTESAKMRAVGSTTPAYFKTFYLQFQNYINFTDKWLLTSITDSNNNGIILTYETLFSTRNSSDPVSLYLPGTTTATLQYKICETINPVRLKSITSNNPNDTRALNFLWVTFDSGMIGVDLISGFGRAYTFNYSNVAYGTNLYKRSFLREVSESECSSPVNYQFGYAGETQSGGNYTTVLPDSTFVNVDYWGFANYAGNPSLMPKVWINPSNNSLSRYSIYQAATGGGSYIYQTTNGYSRASSNTNLGAGCLTLMKYGTGGTTTIAYEQNSYIDKPSNAVVYGGGIRVSAITDFDGFDNTKNMVRSFLYIDPTTGVTSGRPISLPAFAFTIPYSGNATGSALWNVNTVVSDNDMSDEDHSINYAYSKISQTGKGSIQYQFYIPATNWDANAAPACASCVSEWTPTINLSARNNCSATYGPVKNDIYSYPFIPNIDYDSERGILQKITSLNDAGTKVAETTYSYVRSGTPSTITGFRYDDNPNGALLAKVYNKYQVFYNVGELTATISKVVFDSQTLIKPQTTTVRYAYDSPNHKLPTSESITNSDNSILTTYHRYVKDYAVASGSNPNITALYAMQQQNMNLPVENWQQITRSGNTLTTSANLILYSGFVSGAYTFNLPAQQLTMVIPDGGGFTPISISGQTLTKDSHYFTARNFSAYDAYGFLQSQDDGNKIITTSITDHSTNHETASFKGASYKEVAFSDFDSDKIIPADYNFSITGTGTFTASGSHSGSAYGLGAGQIISKTISLKSAPVLNYIFSVWIKAPVGGSLNFNLTGGTPSTFSKTFNAGDWTYYEWKCPVTPSATSLSLSLSATQSISIDDILFYPDVSSVTTSSYDPLNGYKTVETNTNGVSTYFKSDQWGRSLAVFDQDKNIVKAKSYYAPGNVATGLQIPSISSGSNPTILVPFTLTATPTACLVGESYNWNYGDGTTETTYSNAPSHTYNSLGTFTVSVTATHPQYGSKSASVSVTVNPPPLSPSICLSGVQKYDDCNNKAVITQTCGSNPTGTHVTYFNITSLGGTAYGTISYRWQISYDNGSTWADEGTTTSQLSIDCNRQSISYKARCIVTTSSGQSGTSNVLGFVALPPC